MICPDAEQRYGSQRESERVAMFVRVWHKAAYLELARVCANVMLQQQQHARHTLAYCVFVVYVVATAFVEQTARASGFVFGYITRCRSRRRRRRLHQCAQLWYDCHFGMFVFVTKVES